MGEDSSDSADPVDPPATQAKPQVGLWSHVQLIWLMLLAGVAGGTYLFALPGVTHAWTMMPRD